MIPPTSRYKLPDLHCTPLTLQLTGPVDVLRWSRFQHLQELWVVGVHRVLAMKKRGISVMHLTGGRGERGGPGHMQHMITGGWGPFSTSHTYWCEHTNLAVRGGGPGHMEHMIIGHWRHSAE